MAPRKQKARAHGAGLLCLGRKQGLYAVSVGATMKSQAGQLAVLRSRSGCASLVANHKAVHYSLFPIYSRYRSVSTWTGGQRFSSGAYRAGRPRTHQLKLLSHSRTTDGIFTSSLYRASARLPASISSMRCNHTHPSQLSPSSTLCRAISDAAFSALARSTP